MSTTIETITVTRPMKVIAFTCCTITVFFMIASVSCSDWVNSDGWREGLFVQCIDPNAPTPIPFGTPPIPGCHKAHSAGYVRGTAALVIICVLTDFFGTLLTGLGLRSTDPNKKYKYYRVAIYSLLVATIALFLALIIYPVSLSKEIGDDPKLDGGRAQFKQDFGSLDFDGDGIMDHIDDDDDNDGKLDIHDDDDDNDGIKDVDDPDDDNDGIPDTEDGDDDDFDNDGIPDHLDDDNDNDGTPDDIDTDDDNDGIADDVDNDDDNDGIPDHLDDTLTDTDNDGTPDVKDTDDDNDGTPDDIDNDDDNDGVVDQDLDADNDGTPDSIDNDDDNDGIPDDQEEMDSDKDGIPDSLDNDDDNDGVADDKDNDDDNDGIPDDVDLTGDPRVWNFGFGYGAGWFCVILMFASLTLLICDRESEEIFYKERPVEEDEEAGGD